MQPALHIRRLAACLCLLTALFAFRVLAQLAQSVVDLPFLPPFAAWDSAALPYWLLLAAQIVILVLMIRIAACFSHAYPTPRLWIGRWLLGVGTVYFGLMLARLILGLTVLPDHPWVGRPIPALFHLVLAGFVLILGAWHYREGANR